jgi:hypothetical protein
VLRLDLQQFVSSLNENEANGASKVAVNAFGMCMYSTGTKLSFLVLIRD